MTQHIASKQVENAKPAQTPWQALVDQLAAEGVRVLFGMPGGAKHLYDALYDQPAIRPVLVRHETSGAFMAHAYARVSGELGVCLGCPGPGVANLVPGILEAWSACMPVLALGVRAPTRTFGMGAFQEADQLRIFRPITKWAFTVERPERVGWAVRRAISLATTGQPGPVYLELPADVALTPVVHPPMVRADRTVRPAPDPARVEQAIHLLAAARRPLLICGGGVILGRAHQAVRRFAETFGIPVQTTASGRGCFPEDHPLFAGLIGLYRTEYAQAVYEQADLLIAVGTRFEEFQSGNWHYFPAGARLVQIDIAAEELGRNWIPDLAIHGDAALTLEALTAAGLAHGLQPNPARVAELAAGHAEAVARAAQDAYDPQVPVRGKRVAWMISRVFDRNCILVNENGAQDLWAYYWPYTIIGEGNAVVPPAEQTAMGFGVCGAIGAKLARPEATVVCTTGDGAFQMGLHELPTAVQERAPVVWVIFNDRALGWPRWTQQTALGGRVIATEFHARFDFVTVARAAGCWAQRVETPEELGPALEAAKRANADGVPAVVDVAVDSQEHHPSFVAFHSVR